ncbi:DNA mismatch repair protein MutS [Gillisia sp. M10.2A]|uniref:DNA mismatch repair protein MutS n=1 Tax=Gillisia lutea TaxID=2909668 RepID=A0ABS9ELN1_9FLAO|nr:Smr/MutS family protein [Gillisia lutea]MCF4102794.1 DNA mismatch repair protein MutS [Gillisia lutea]
MEGFTVGDRVAVLDDALEGKVIKVNGEAISIETTEGFLLDFQSSELVKIDSDQSRMLNAVDIPLSKILKEKQPVKRLKSTRIKPKERSAPPMEVDLHIEKLVRSHGNMSNYDILSLQIETAVRQIEFAISKRIPKIVFIHGVGEGVLKAELDFMLGRYDNLKFYDADFQKYGAGATEVYIFQNA